MNFYLCCAPDEFFFWILPMFWVDLVPLIVLAGQLGPSLALLCVKGA